MKTSLLLIITFFFGVNCYAQNNLEYLKFGKKLMVYSEIMNDSMECWIRTPEKFEKANPKMDSISLLVLLDGDEYFKISSDILEIYEWSDKAPLTMIVALPSTVASRWKYYTPSTSTYTGKDPKDSVLYANSGQFTTYEKAIKDELFPSLEKQYDVEFNSKTIFGHSNGGLGALSFYTSGEEVFDNYIIASPAILWDNYYLLNHIPTEEKLNKIYLTLGTNGWDYSLKSYAKLNELMKHNPNYKFQVNAQESHATNGLRSLLDGLIYVNKKENKIQ
ncbi:alpha/beta hydrolase [Flammeovirga pacifica]|uniref:Esterase n=1 Tax=Flammeovirga pacifica TaxID=915059 RepID=A0A1S1YRY3_FLAPC|nr:alpha/beta hydrolase-fold protein [Flammeovirga pacifica]OHX63798.1 hypothetical protein NH26_24810 [Flammeovirga pacifica]